MPDAKPVIVQEEEGGVGRKRRRHEEEAHEVLAAQARDKKEAMEAEAIRQVSYPSARRRT